MSARFNGGRRTALGAAAAAAALAVLAACGSDNAATPPTPVTTTTTTTTLPAAQVLVSGSELIPARQVFWKDVTTTKTGLIDVTIDYPAVNSVPMWLTDRQCSPQFFQQDRCDYLVKSVEGTGQKTMFADNVPAGTYTLFISNDGPVDATVGYSVTLTAAAGAAGRIRAGAGGLLPRR